MIAPQTRLVEQLGWKYEKTSPFKMGLCRWCNRETELFKSVSPSFSQFSALGLDPSEPFLCRSCSAALFHIKPIHWDHCQIVLGKPGTSIATHPSDLMIWLSRPVSEDRCVLVQSNRQKRSVLAARWGTVATTYDSAPQLWDQADVDRLHAYEQLRWQHGVSETQIFEPSPRPAAIKNAQDFKKFMDLWKLVKEWDIIKLEIATLATRRTQKK